MSARLSFNVFTPLPPQATEIANVNVPVLRALARHADVTVWAPQDEWLPIETQGLRVRSFRGDAILDAELNGSDVNIFHIGNHPGFHEDILDVCLRVPGIVVLHDLNLHHLFVGLVWLSNRRDTYCAAVARCYGPEEAAAARVTLDQGDAAPLMERHPLTVAPAAAACALITHNQAALEELRTRSRLPVYYLPLPFAAPECHPPRKQAPRPPYRLIVFGFLGQNRRLETTLRALSESPVRRKFTLDIYGSCENPPEIEALIDQFGLRDQVTLHGFVPFETLNDALDQADLALNLRFPTFGEASASQLRIWSHGLPSVVTRVGWYATLPDDAVACIDQETELDDLKHRLLDFCCDPARFQAMGRRGREEVITHHTPEHYAQGLLSIAREAPRQHMARARADATSRLRARLTDLGMAEPAQLAETWAGRLFDAPAPCSEPPPLPK